MAAYARAGRSTRAEMLRVAAQALSNAEDDAVGAKQCARCGVKIMPSTANPWFAEGFCGKKCAEYPRKGDAESA